ncbi:hypothetical protein LCGC14_3029340 [marine sediment metagenome]|uniref:Uncharacterized protein n=1 Tax=marine sediment metagenome TaxID=412755 RepID=A0A0F8XG49_9ZZZZ
MTQSVPLIIESPVYMIEGETITWSITWLGVSSLASPTAVVYKDGTDVSSTVMASGSHLVSGNVQTLKPVVAGSTDGGKRYTVIIEAVVDSGNTERRKLMVIIIKASAEV